MLTLLPSFEMIRAAPQREGRERYWTHRRRERGRLGHHGIMKYLQKGVLRVKNSVVHSLLHSCRRRAREGRAFKIEFNMESIQSNSEV